jgi:hypothetical protein
MYPQYFQDSTYGMDLPACVASVLVGLNRSKSMSAVLDTILRQGYNRMFEACVSSVDSVRAEGMFSTPPYQSALCAFLLEIY